MAQNKNTDLHDRKPSDFTATGPDESGRDLWLRARGAIQSAHVSFLESETAEGFLKLAWRQADACKYVFMKTLAFKCAFKYVCVCVHGARTEEQEPVYNFYFYIHT